MTPLSDKNGVLQGLAVFGSGGFRLAGRVYYANGWRDQLRGLIGWEIGADEALVLPGCAQVHTAILRYPIDVAFCGSNCCAWRVLRVETLLPWRISPPVRGANLVIEMRALSPLRRLEEGACIRYAPATPDSEAVSS